MILTKINQVAFQCAGKKQTCISWPVETDEILLKSLEECNYDATRFHDLIA